MSGRRPKRASGPFELQAAGIRVLGEVTASGERVVSIYRGGALVEVISANAAAALGVAIQAVAACALHADSVS